MVLRECDPLDTDSLMVHLRGEERSKTLGMIFT